MGGPDDLKGYLYGSEPLLSRLEFAKKAFLGPLDVPTIIKEDVVVLWLTRLITTKALMLSSEELEAAWRTLEDILSSQRLQALCDGGWMCPLTSNFLETVSSLLLHDSKGTGDNMQSYAVKICRVLLSNSHLSTLLTHRPNQCLDLLKGVIEWVIQGHKSNDDISLTLTLTAEVNTYLKCKVDKKIAVTSVVDHIFLPSARLHVALKEEERDNVKCLLQELRSLITRNLFNGDLKQMYHDVLASLFSEESKVSLPEDVEKIFTCMVTTIDTESVELSEYLLSEFLTSFSIAFKNDGDMSHRMVIVLCFIIGISVKGSCILSINRNNLVCQQLISTNCDQEKQERLLSSLLMAVENVHFNHDAKLDNIAPNRWLQNLADLIMKHGLQTASGYKCLQTVLHVNPKNTVNLILNNFCSIVRSMGKTDSCEIVKSNSLHSASDDLLCDVLQVYCQLREVPSMFVSILKSLFKVRTWVSQKCNIMPESLHVYEGNLLFPPRFMFSTMKVFGSLGHTNVIATWKVFISLLKENFSMDESETPWVSVTVWLLSCILRAFPVMDMIQVSGVLKSVAEMMNETAKEGIQPFIAAMLTLPHNNDVCGSLLVLCHTWGELHSNLCSYDKYLECEGVSPVQPPECNQPATDFSYLLPFISSDMWAQISARVANFGNRPTQLALVQLVLQKLSHVIQYHEINFDVRCREQSMSPTRQIIEAATKYVLNALEVWGPGVMELLPLHLTYLLPFIHDVHIPTIARYLVNGFQEGKKCWMNYVYSDHFLEAYRLHPQVLSCICSTLAANLGSRKRKISESEDDSLPKKNYIKKLFTKLANVGSLSFEHGTSNQETITNLLSECGVIFGKLMDSKSRGSESSGCVRNIDVMMNLLRRFPFTFESEYNKTIILLILLSVLVNDEFNSKQEKFDVLHTMTLFLKNHESIFVLSVIDIDVLLKWFIEKRVSMPGSVLSPKVILLTKVNSEIILKQQQEPANQVDVSESLDTLISHEFDLLFRCFINSKECKENVDYLLSLAEHITSSEELSADEDARLHLAVLLLSVCQKKKIKVKKTKLEAKKREGESKMLAFQHLSSWILQFLKKLDLATIPPSTAASLLIAHTIILSEYAKTSSIGEKAKDSINGPESSETGALANDSATEIPLKKKKTPKYLKLLNRSIKLGELCLSSSNPYLVEHTLNFFVKVGERSFILKSHVSPDLLTVMWSTLCQRDLLSPNVEFSQLSRFCLYCLLPLASSEEFENILKDLIRTTQTQTNIVQALLLWQLVIPAKVNERNVILRRTAMEHLIPLLVNLVTLQNPKTSSVELLLPVVETVRVAIKSRLAFSSQSRALALKLCASIHLHLLSFDNFHKIFSIVVDIMNSILLQYSDFAMERIPSVLAVVGQFSEALVAQSSQDHKLGDDELKILVDCSNNFERLVSSVASHRKELKSVIHFTIARIVISLQQTVVCKDVRTILETIVYRLLDICSEHGLNHLLVTLPQANITLLKHLHKNFREFYRYRSNAAAREPSINNRIK